MSKNILWLMMIAFVVATGPEAALADDWSGQPATTAPPGSLGPYPVNPLNTVQMGIRCNPGGTLPPCTPGQTPFYAALNPVTYIDSIPPGVGASDSIGVLLGGTYSDPAAPAGLSFLQGAIPLTAFARSDTVDALSGTVSGLGTTVGGLTTTVGGLSGTVGGLSTSVASLNNTVGGLSSTVNGLTTTVSSLNSTVGLLSGTVGTLSNTVNSLSASIGTINANLGSLSTTVGGLSTTVNNLGTSFTALSSTVNGLQGTVNSLNANVGTLSTQLSSLSIRFDQFQQQVHLEEQTLREGVAMSLAMDGVGDLGPDEKVAISMNVGTYGGQNGIAAGIAFRAAEHLTFNGGIGTGFNRGLVGGRAGVRLAW